MSALPDVLSDTAFTLRKQQLLAACARIAPAWPLDQMIAVNPLWHWREQSFSDVAATMAALGNMQCLMSVEHYRALWDKTITARHLEQACTEQGIPFDLDKLLAEQDETELPQWYNVSDLIDAEKNKRHGHGSSISWHDEIIHQLSQFCGNLLQTVGPQSLDAQTFYTHWLDTVRADRGLAILMDTPALPRAFTALPDALDDLYEFALDTLCEHDDAIGDYGVALLLDIHGWASALSWLRWQAQLRNSDHSALEGLLAARLAWELVLRDIHGEDSPSWQLRWQQQWQQVPRLMARHRQAQQSLLAWQRASELAFQSQLVAQLQQPVPAQEDTSPLLQAAFCIDVRSEVIRRALEAQHPRIQTLGFAGFFGLPIAWQPGHADYLRPQLPGLLAPALTVVPADNTLTAPGTRWTHFTGQAPATFSAVESGGLFYLFKLLKQSLFPSSPQPGVASPAMQTRFRLLREQKELSVDERAQLARGILSAMGLAGELAPRVLLVGHGSSTCNNPQAAGLDCGACCGQTGEINVRVLAQLLNDTDVRSALAEQGVGIPDNTRFIAALHDTTTDEIRCFDTDDNDIDATLTQWLDNAGKQARRERATRLGTDEKHVDKVVQQRSRDWSEVRPEWGLAGNACFIVAPRARNRHLDLGGRSFLHDYHWQQDSDFSLLELIMTAPMVVAHWINMQYNLSVTDNVRFGSGNKALHNVVGGKLGVFEGNGGDLRVGLALQSVHDGKQWMHEPLRLSVFIAAPQHAIDAVLEKHDTVRQLVEGEWLFLYRLGETPDDISRWHQGRWIAGQPDVSQ